MTEYKHPSAQDFRCFEKWIIMGAKNMKEQDNDKN